MSRARGAGFGLVEVLAAVALLGVAVAALSTTATAVLGDARRSGTAEAAAASAMLALSELRGLPAVPASDGEPSLLGAVFPHADRARNLPEGYYSDGEDGTVAGSFVSLRRAGNDQLRLLAVFVTGDSLGWHAVPVDALFGYSLAGTGPLPGSAVLLTVQVRGREDGWTTAVTTVVPVRIGEDDDG